MLTPLVTWQSYIGLLLDFGAQQHGFASALYVIKKIMSRSRSQTVKKASF